MVSGDDQVGIVAVKRVALQRIPDPPEQVVVLPKRLVIVKDAVVLPDLALHPLVEVRFLVRIAKVNHQQPRMALWHLAQHVHQRVDVGAGV